MLDVRRRKVWTIMAARRLLPRRHRVMIILISPLSFAARQPDDCYNQGNEKGPGSGESGPLRKCGGDLSYFRKSLILSQKTWSGWSKQAAWMMSCRVPV
jgi:hypothetical protein